MKLLLAMINNDDAQKVMKSLIKEKIQVTKIASTGGFLKTGNTTLLIGVADDIVEKALNIIQENSKSRKKIVSDAMTSEFGMFSGNPMEVTIGGGTIFILDVLDYKKI